MSSCVAGLRVTSILVQPASTHPLLLTSRYRLKRCCGESPPGTVTSGGGDVRLEFWPRLSRFTATAPPPSSSAPLILEHGSTSADRLSFRSWQSRRPAFRHVAHLDSARPRLYCWRGDWTSVQDEHSHGRQSANWGD